MILDDGTLKFTLVGGEKAIAGSIDLLVLELACNELVQTHGLQVRDDGRYQTTAEFAVALAARLTTLCTFDPAPHDLTPTQAHTLWVQSGEMVATVKKNTVSTPTSPSPTSSTPSAQPLLQESSTPGCC
jgi:hypothetical protein